MDFQHPGRQTRIVARRRERAANWESSAATIRSQLFPKRTTELVTMLRGTGLYPKFDPPSFNGYGGWVTGSTAETLASQRASNAVVAALAPICVENFNRGKDVPARFSAMVDATSLAPTI